MPIIELEIKITLKAPFLTQSSAPMDYGLDVVLARNYEQKYYIPGTLIIGKLREAWEELKSLETESFKPEIDAWLGKESDPNRKDDEPESTVLPQRKKLYIEDLVTSETANDKSSPNFRIRMDKELGTVEKGAYIVTECPFAAGQEITFQGTARFLANDKSEIVKHLRIGLQWIQQIGANGTIGFGEVIKVEVKEINRTSSEKSSFDYTKTKYDLRIIPQAPFCVAERRIAGNLFQSSEIIPGGVLKGTIANMWISLMDSEGSKVDENLDKERPNLSKHFDKIRFTHAFPSPAIRKERPVKPPLSLVKADKEIYDVALYEKAGLINGNAPEFAIDWKEHSDVQRPFGWFEIKQELRVRTAIESDNRRSSEGQLFAYEMIVPKYKDKNGKDDEFVWYASLDLADIKNETERAKVVEELQSLIKQGVTGLGKTKAFTRIDLLENYIANVCESKLEPTENGLWIITLQTPALLCNPLINQEKHSNKKLRFWPFNKKTETIVSQTKNLKEAYSEVWQQLSDNELQLEHFFATQSLAGGFYLWKRFQKESYQPYLLTDAGSVFVLKSTGNIQKAQAFINKWFKHGLPLPDWTIKEYKLSGKEYNYWSLCPYIKHNGYGEIAVNLNVHWDNKPQNFDPSGKKRKQV